METRELSVKSPTIMESAQYLHFELQLLPRGRLTTGRQQKRLVITTTVFHRFHFLSVPGLNFRPLYPRVYKLLTLTILVRIITGA